MYTGALARAIFYDVRMTWTDPFSGEFRIIDMGPLFTGWAEAVCHGRLIQDTTRRYNVGVVFKRAEGTGRIQRIEGLESLMAHLDEHIVHIDLVQVGQPRRDYRKVVEGDGWVVVRHPDLETTVEMANRVATDLRMFAG